MKIINLNFFIDGPDRVGKSTVAKLISKKYFFEKPLYNIHLSGIKTNNKIQIKRCNEHMQDIVKILKSNKRNCIFDRITYICEYVYGTLYRNYNKKQSLDLFKYEKYLKDNCVLIIIIDSTLSMINRDDGESWSNEINNKKQEQLLFKQAFEISKIKNKIFIDSNDLRYIENKIIHFINNINKKRV